MTEYRESFSEKKCDNEEYRSSTVYYDGDERKWKCHCAGWLREGRCSHLRWFKGQVTLIVSDRYL